MLLAQSTQMKLPRRASLSEADRIPPFAYFITSGLASIVAEMQEGTLAEVGVIGHEGIVGSLELLGPTPSQTTCFMQLDGSGLRIPLIQFRSAFKNSEQIRDRTLEFVQHQMLTVSQIAGCNRLHNAEERLARWLLMVHDRIESDTLDLTQEFLAEMLGAQRTTVTAVAGKLQKSGSIEYSRGRVRILNRESLEKSACDCYQVTKRLYANLYQHSDSSMRSLGNGFAASAD